MARVTKRQLDEQSVRKYIISHGNFDFNNYKKFPEARSMDEATFKWHYRHHFVDEWNRKSSYVTEVIAKEKLKAMMKGLSGYNPVFAKKVGKSIVCHEYGKFDGDKTLISFDGNQYVTNITEFCKVRNKKTMELECVIFKVDVNGIMEAFTKGPIFIVIDREGMHQRRSTAFLKDTYAATGSLRKTYETIH